MKKLGQFLKSEREKQNLKLEDLAARTKIHIQKLQHIEAGDPEQLPAKVFCVGLIKSYARELHIDMDQLNPLIEEAFREPTDLNDQPAEDVTKPAPKKSVTEDEQVVGLFKVPRVAVIGASILASLALLFVIIQVIEKMNSYSQEEALPPEVFLEDTPEVDLLMESSVVDSDEASDVEKPQKASTQTSAEKPSSMVSKPAETIESKKPEPVKPQAVATPDPKPSPTTKPKPMDVSEGDFSEDNFGSSAPKADVVSDNKLTILALEPVRAEVVWSDGFVQVMLLKSKESKTLVFSQPITLRVNNGGAIKVSFNEAEQQVPGSFNEPIEIQYP